MFFKVACATVAVLCMSAPAEAYTVVGTLPAGSAFFYISADPDRDGDLAIRARFTSVNPFSIDQDSALWSLEAVYYDYFDPETGESLGGNDNLGTQQPRDYFGGGAATTRFDYSFAYPGAQRRHDYVIQALGDAYASEIGWYQTQLSLIGLAEGGAPIDYRVVVSVPEPGTWSLLVAGCAGTGLAMRRRRPATF